MNRITYGNTIEQNTKNAVLHHDGNWKHFAKTGQKVEAIKALRGMFAPVLGLKESKDIVEEYASSPGYFDNMFQQYHDSFITFKKVNGTIVVKKDDGGGYVVTETTTHEIHSEKEMLEYVYSLGLRHGSPSAH